MHINWLKFGNYLWDNKTAIGIYSFGMMTAAIKIWPNPDKKWLCVQTLKDFWYDWSHQQWNITNTRLNATPIITPPENKEAVLPSPKQ